MAIQGSVSAEHVQDLAKRLSFARSIEDGSDSVLTVQAQLELSAGGGTRKVTSHALHGLHPYKGKFYPQLARSLLNVCGVPAGGIVVDPFAGCGTSVLEASLLGIQGFGIDANPMAVLVSQAKLQLLATPVSRLKPAFRRLRNIEPGNGRLPDEDYLKKWFPPGNMAFLRAIIPGIGRLREVAIRNGALVALSSVLREASYQDPAQLRVGRRKEGEIPDLRELFEAALDDLLQDLQAIHDTPGVDWQKIPSFGSCVVLGDARRLASAMPAEMVGSVDAVITSPPYANALPYIDTDRLSLRLLDLLPNGSQRQAEGALIGNREVGEPTLRELGEDLRRELVEQTWITSSLADVIRETVEVAKLPASGFRKQRTPYLLFAYFRDMKAVLGQIAKVLRPGGQFALVVGDNTVSGLSGPQTVPTAEILEHLAQHQGLTREEEFTKRLTSFGASDTVHQRNAMATERVLLFRKGPRPVN